MLSGEFQVYSLLACCLNIVFITTRLFQLHKSTVYLVSHLSFLIPSIKLPVTPAVFYLPTLAFQSPNNHHILLVLSPFTSSNLSPLNISHSFPFPL